MNNRQILLKSRPEGAPGLDNFQLTEGPMPEPGEGEVLMRTLYLSLDPYMRGRMSAAKSYAKPAAHRAADGRRHGRRGRRVAQSDNTRSATSSSATAAGRSTRCRVARAAQARSGGGAGLDRARRARHAGDDRVCRAARNRPAEARRDGRGGGGLRRGRLGGRADRQDQGLPRGRHRRRRREVPLRRPTSSASMPASTHRARRSCQAARGRLPERHRRLFRECRRRRAADASGRCSTTSRAFRSAG